MAIVAPMTFVGIARIARQTFATLFFCGPVAAWALLSTNMRRKMGAPRARCYHLHPRRLLHPVTVRAGSADMFVFAQILADHEFAPLDKQDFRSVIDLGGNIGLASAWFLSTFGHSKVVTIEANPDNYSLLEENLKLYGERSVVVKGGVWPHRTKLAIVRRENESDAQVREAQPGDLPADMIEAWDISSLMELGGFSSIDLLKVDIEGAELGLFSEGTDRWLPHVRNLTIELHGSDCEGALERALRNYDYTRTTCGELLFCSGLRPKPTMASAD
jgi:FkbM family methyltransferase